MYCDVCVGRARAPRRGEGPRAGRSIYPSARAAVRRGSSFANRARAASTHARVPSFASVRRVCLPRESDDDVGRCRGAGEGCCARAGFVRRARGRLCGGPYLGLAVDLGGPSVSLSGVRLDVHLRSSRRAVGAARRLYVHAGPGLVQRTTGELLRLCAWVTSLLTASAQVRHAKQKTQVQHIGALCSSGCTHRLKPIVPGTANVSIPITASYSSTARASQCACVR